MNIAPSRCGIGRCGALALPVEQRFTDGIIVVHGCRGIILIRLIQCYKENIRFLFRQVFNALTNSIWFHKIHCHENLIARVSTMQVQRTSKAEIYRFIDEINMIEAILQKCNQLTEHNRTIGKIIEIFKHLITVPVTRSFTPHGDIEHLQHSLFLIGKLIKIHVHKSRQNIKQKGNPASRINHSKARKCLCHSFFQCFLKIIFYTRPCRKARKAIFYINAAYIKMVIIQKVLEC